MTPKMLFNIFYDSFPELRDRVYAYQEDNSKKNTIKIIFKKDDPMYKSGRFSISYCNHILELEGK